MANYEDVLSIACHRNEKIEYTDFNLSKPHKTNTPWTFVIMQVWREGSKQDITGMTFMSVLDVVENRVETNTPEEPQLIYKCGLEMEEEQQHTINTTAKQSLNNKAIQVNVSHAHSVQRDALVQFGSHDWDDVIKKVVERKQ